MWPAVNVWKLAWADDSRPELLSLSGSACHTCGVIGGIFGALTSTVLHLNKSDFVVIAWWMDWWIKMQMISWKDIYYYSNSTL